MANPVIESVVQLVEILSPNDFHEHPLALSEQPVLISPDCEIPRLLDFQISPPEIPYHFHSFVLGLVGLHPLLVKLKPLVEHLGFELAVGCLFCEFVALGH